MNYLIYGTSYKLIDLEIEKILQKQDYTTYDLSEIPFEDILNDLNYSSMFDGNKATVIKSAELLFESKKENKSSLESLLNYLSLQNNPSTLILISSLAISKKTKLMENILSHFQIIKTPIMTKSYELAKFLQEHLAKNQYRIDAKTAETLAVKCALNIDVVLMEIEKLKLIKGNNKTITLTDIENFVSNYNTNDLYGLKDAILNKNIPLAVTLLEDLETAKIEVISLVVMLAKEYQTLYNIHELATLKLSNEEIGQKLDNMHPYRIKILKEASNKYSKNELERIIKYLCNLDLKIISEDNLGFDELRKFLLTI